MSKGIKLHPLNAKGRYYIDQNICLICEECFHAAPKNFSYDNNSEYGSYVARQPETPDEEAQCREAMGRCPLEAIYDDGEDL